MGDTMKKVNKDLLSIALLITLISGLHYFTLVGYWPIHDFYRRLYYLPIIIAAFKFRLKGGFITSLIVVLIYAPHLIFYFGEINIQVVNQFLELGMFMIVGMITGYLVEKDYHKRGLLEFQLIQLANLENYTYNILDSLNSGVIALDRSYNVPSTNKQALVFFNDSKEILPFLKKNNLVEELDKIFKGEAEQIESEVLLEQRDGSKQNLKIVAQPIKNIKGVKEGIVLLIEDITNIKELQLQVKRSERLSAIGQLASGIAHEVRNPLGIIKTISQTIEEDIKDLDTKEAIEIILHETDRANRVIQELLDFAKPYKYQVIKAPLGKQLLELLVLTNKYGEQRGVEIIVDIKDECIIEGDFDKLKQAFLNIVLNGIQAMEKGGELMITLEIVDQQLAMITFQDQGTGISMENLDKMFDPFYTTKDQGTGLGLSITHRIIEEHDGRIEVISEVGKGTRVKILLPIINKEEVDA